MKIIFFGSDDFAAVHLRALIAAGETVLCCVTGPDKPQGRGMQVAISPIKRIALEHHIPCLQPVSLKEAAVEGALKGYGVDIFIVVAYGKLLPQQILDIPRLLCLNVHGSLLPRYRGAAPVNWAILNGDQQTGVSIQKMVLELDAGAVAARQVMDIGPQETAAQLRARMAEAGASLLVDLLKKYPSGNFPLTPQDETLVTYAPKLTREMGRIDWNKAASVIARQVRGLSPWPGTHALFKGKMVKILRARESGQQATGIAGEVLKADKNGLHVACGGQGLLIEEVQPQAGKVMPAASFAAGQRLTPGAMFE